LSLSLLTREYLTLIALKAGLTSHSATPLISSRVRFCLSASHTKHDIDLVLRACAEVGDILDLRHGGKDQWSVEDVIAAADELVAATF
jgi:serine palmitoyltransferase